MGPQNPPGTKKAKPVFHDLKSMKIVVCNHFRGKQLSVMYIQLKTIIKGVSQVGALGERSILTQESVGFGRILLQASCVFNEHVARFL